MTTPPTFEIIVGTYEEYLLGYKVTINNEKWELKQSFATHEHSSSLRTVATSGKYLASGGADDRICVYDMVARKEHVMLTNHDSTVNCVQFTNDHSHLMSSSLDGHLSITRVGNWLVEKMWEKAHKNGYVLDIAIHSSGKLALTLGSDCSLQTWNLVKGRKAYIINLNSKSTDAKSLNFIKWGLCEEKFILGGGNNLEIWSISTGGILNKYNYKSKVVCATWINENIVIIGHENGKITIQDLTENETKEYEVHKNRIKCLEYKNNFLITCSSSGNIKLWKLHNKELDEICETNTGCRLTCIALVDGITVKKEEEPEETNESVVIENRPKPIISKQRIIIEEGSDEDSPQKSQRKNKKRKHKKSKNNPIENGDQNNSEANHTPVIKKKKQDDSTLETPNKTKNKQRNKSIEAITENDATPKSKKKKQNNSIVDETVSKVNSKKKKKSKSCNEDSFAVTPSKVNCKEKNKLNTSTDNWNVE